MPGCAQGPNLAGLLQTTTLCRGDRPGGYTSNVNTSDVLLQVERWKAGKLVSTEEVIESGEDATADAEDGEWDEDEQVTAVMHPTFCRE